MKRKFISINNSKCVGCRLCLRACPLGNVLRVNEQGKVELVPGSICAGCMRCLDRCPNKAIVPQF